MSIDGKLHKQPGFPKLIGSSEASRRGDVVDDELSSKTQPQLEELRDSAKAELVSVSQKKLGIQSELTAIRNQLRFKMDNESYFDVVQKQTRFSSEVSKIESQIHKIKSTIASAQQELDRRKLAQKAAGFRRDDEVVEELKAIRRLLERILERTEKNR